MKVTLVLASLVALASAWESPQYTGWNRQWQATFTGRRGTPPHPSNWNMRLGDLNDNNEFQRWTSNPNNVQFSGSGTLQIVPLRDSTAPNGWTSARIESRYVVLPRDGRITRIEASLRLAGNPQRNKQGIWPAFWMLGESHRQGTKKWPECGEIDIFENINGEAIGHAVTHCDKYPGGACNEPYGLGAATTLPDSKYHVWRVEFDRRNRDWKQQSITWSMDGKQFHRITGQLIGNATVWASLAHNPMFMILNVAVGGNWPGAPNADTLGGTGSMMEVGYVAHYLNK